MAAKNDGVAKGAAATDRNGAAARRGTAEKTAKSEPPASSRRVSSVPPIVEEVLDEKRLTVEKFVECFDVLVEAAGGTKSLRELVLDLAMCGKLTRADRTDEAAEILLGRAIRARELLVDGREASNGDTSPLDDPSFTVPAHWRRTRIGKFAVVRGGKRLPAGATFASEPTPWVYVQVTNMKRGTIDNANLKYLDEDTRNVLARYTIAKDDLYITIAGTIGDVGEVPHEFDGMNLTENAAKIVFRELNKRYVLTALRSNLLQTQFASGTNQMAQPKLALRRIADAQIPVPPLAEQKRIVARVDQLMALIDDLEAKQTRKRELGKKLVEAMIRDLLQ